MPAVAERISLGERIAGSNTRFTYGERLNIAPSGKRFRCEFIEPGLVNYSDVGGDVELLRKETIDAALDSVRGNPLTIGHVSTRINAVELKRLTRGEIDQVGYDEKTGWFFCEGTVTDDHARDRLRMNAKPSCGYVVLEFGPGGVHHNIPYAREITKIKFHHLAIVDNPRYEEAKIRLNAKTQENPAMFKWIKNILRPAEQAGGEQKTETVTGEIPADASIEIDGKPVRFNDVVAAKVAADRKIADEAAARDNALDGDTMIEYAPGKTAKLNELTACYQTFGCPEKKNEADEAKDKEEKEKKDRENALKNQGAASFRVLSSARATPPPVQTERANSANTLDEQVERGRSRYGTVKHGAN